MIEKKLVYTIEELGFFTVQLLIITISSLQKLVHGYKHCPHQGCPSSDLIFLATAILKIFQLPI